MKNAALLVIDAQVNMFDPAAPVYQADRILKTLRQLIGMAHRTELQVVFIRNNGSPGEVDEPGTPGWEIHPKLRQFGGDIIIDKWTPDSFFQTGLEKALAQRKIGELLLCGMQTDFCIVTTCQSAVAKGYKVILIADAHSTYDTDEMSASEIIEKANEDMHRFALVLPANEVQFQSM
jgi:streptothricin hydrolase